jgi:hypothetical protein
MALGRGRNVFYSLRYSQFRQGLLLHDPHFPKPPQNILIHPRQPLLLKPRLASCRLHRLLQVLAHKSDEVDLVHGVRVCEFALAYVLGGFGVCRVVRLGGPVE